ncbi:MAG: hypothetical protein J6N76_03740, partial [Lachnospiraceae bacterium]|nr:hypothetical protein [Lachnospiraceae bacterium]
RTIWIHEGRIKEQGQPAAVHNKYLEYMGIRKPIETAEEVQETISRNEEQITNSLKSEKTKINEVTLQESGKERKLTYRYEVDGKEGVNELSFIFEEGKVRCIGTDILSGDDQQTEVFMKTGEFLASQIRLLHSSVNILKDMLTNDKCDRNDREICLHPGGLIYGPYVKVLGLAYTYVIDADITGAGDIACRITAGGGEREIKIIPLKNGRNEGTVVFDGPMTGVEFVLDNSSDADIVIKQLMFG